MGEYIQKFNPLSGNFQYVPKAFSKVTFKDCVPDFDHLPLQGNEVGDARITNDTHNLYIWDGSRWTNQGDVLDINWESINGKPSSPVSEIDDIVNKGIKTNKNPIVYYVSPNGNNENNGLTPDTPFASIQYAIDLLPKNLSNFVEIILLPGIYNEKIKIENFQGNGVLSFRSINYDRNQTIISPQLNSGENIIEVLNCSSLIYLSWMKLYSNIQNINMICAYQSTNVLISFVDFYAENTNITGVYVGTSTVTLNNNVSYGTHRLDKYFFARYNSVVHVDYTNKEGFLSYYLEEGSILTDIDSMKFQNIVVVDSVNGNDDNGGSFENPVKTIKKALAIRKNCNILNIILLPGLYEENDIVISGFKFVKIVNTDLNQSVIIKSNIQIISSYVVFENIQFNHAINDNSSIILVHSDLFLNNAGFFRNSDEITYPLIFCSPDCSSKIKLRYCYDVFDNELKIAKLIKTESGYVDIIGNDFSDRLITEDSYPLIVINGEIKRKIFDYGVIYVDGENGSDSNKGNSWETALKTIEKAFEVSYNKYEFGYILLKEGTYEFNGICFYKQQYGNKKFELIGAGSSPEQVKIYINGSFEIRTYMALGFYNLSFIMVGSCIVIAKNEDPNPNSFVNFCRCKFASTHENRFEFVIELSTSCYTTFSNCFYLEGENLYKVNYLCNNRGGILVVVYSSIFWRNRFWEDSGINVINGAVLGVNYAAIYVNSEIGSDSNPGTEEYPVNKIQTALSLANNYYKEADIYLSPGIYEIDYAVTIGNNCSITIHGDPNNTFIKLLTHHLIEYKDKKRNSLRFCGISFIMATSNSMLIFNHEGEVYFENCRFGAIEDVTNTSIFCNFYNKGECHFIDCSALTGEGIKKVTYANSGNAGKIEFHNTSDFYSMQNIGSFVYGGNFNEYSYKRSGSYNIYVDPENGVDEGNMGLDPQKPVKTFSLAAWLASNLFKNHVEIVLKPGVYDGIGMGFGGGLHPEVIYVRSETANPDDVIINTKYRGIECEQTITKLIFDNITFIVNNVNEGEEGSVIYCGSTLKGANISFNNCKFGVLKNSLSRIGIIWDYYNPYVKILFNQCVGIENDNYDKISYLGLHGANGIFIELNGELPSKEIGTEIKHLVWNKNLKTYKIDWQNIEEKPGYVSDKQPIKIITPEEHDYYLDKSDSKKTLLINCNGEEKFIHLPDVDENDIGLTYEIVRNNNGNLCIYTGNSNRNIIFNNNVETSVRNNNYSDKFPNLKMLLINPNTWLVTNYIGNWSNLDFVLEWLQHNDFCEQFRGGYKRPFAFIFNSGNKDVKLLKFSFFGCAWGECSGYIRYSIQETDFVSGIGYVPNGNIISYVDKDLFRDFPHDGDDWFDVEFIDKPLLNSETNYALVIDDSNGECNYVMGYFGFGRDDSPLPYGFDVLYYTGSEWSREDIAGGANDRIDAAYRTLYTKIYLRELI